MALACAKGIALDTVWRGRSIEVTPHAVVGAHVRARLPWWAWLSLGAVPAWQWWKLRRQLRTVEHRVGVPLTIQTVRVW